MKEISDVPIEYQASGSKVERPPGRLTSDDVISPLPPTLSNAHALQFDLIEPTPLSPLTFNSEADRNSREERSPERERVNRIDHNCSAGVDKILNISNFTADMNPQNMSLDPNEGRDQ